ncbi:MULTISPECIES: amidohydrolase [unclassified Streptomyces]|uniref:amidohydrolase n=1 Tax=unclassified Streptomyces TaxID=2593676 RepID=UPI00048C2819|nr:MULTISPECIES: amidohydrolase [unclassified Streptomyces]MYY19627.1 amidohydrolase [Streptomyces sp. SID4912]SCD69954.1 hippurate hydrolase [Streptomyces sp. DpondAA-D4]
MSQPHPAQPRPARSHPALALLGEAVRPALTLYLDVHRTPELSGEETRTAALFAERLTATGFDVVRGIGGHGVAGVLRNGDGPRVYLRAELDALPVAERTGLPYASANGAMHACGHDLHLAAAAGAAELLARTTAHWSGTLVVVGQPAEETLTGARAMLADGLYERCGRPDVVLAQHAAPLPAGMVAHGGPHAPVAAASAALTVVLHGRGGHAATPHLTVDPVVTAAAVITRLQTVVSRETAPADQLSLTVGTLRAGTAVNIVPDTAELGIGVRALTDASLDRALAAVDRVVRAECAASACPRDPELTTLSRSPALWCDPATTDAIRAAHTTLYGPERVGTWPASMAAEDFPLYGDAGLAVHGEPKIPLVYWMFGTASPKQWSESGPGLPPNHSPHFAPDIRTALPPAITSLTAAALDRLGGGAGVEQGCSD